MTHSDFNPGYDDLFEPLSLALGHLVFGATALEKAMLTDLIQRRVVRDGPEEVFGQQIIARLERSTAGVLLAALRKLGYAEDLATEIAMVINRRNHFVHHLFEDPEFIRAFATRGGVDGLVTRVEELVEDIYAVIAKLAPTTTSGAESMFGRSIPELLEFLKGLDPADLGDGEERQQLEALQQLPEHLIADDQPPRSRG